MLTSCLARRNQGISSHGHHSHQARRGPPISEPVGGHELSEPSDSCWPRPRPLTVAGEMPNGTPQIRERSAVKFQGCEAHGAQFTTRPATVAGSAASGDHERGPDLTYDQHPTADRAGIATDGRCAITAPCRAGETERKVHRHGFHLLVERRGGSSRKSQSGSCTRTRTRERRCCSAPHRTCQWPRGRRAIRRAHRARTAATRPGCARPVAAFGIGYATVARKAAAGQVGSRRARKWSGRRGELDAADPERQRPARARNSVVLPLPVGPTIAMHSREQWTRSGFAPAPGRRDDGARRR